MQESSITPKRYILSIVNHKGGVGKTTTAVNLSACLGRQGFKVLLVDLDPQGSASLFLGFQDDGDALLQAIQKTAALPIQATAVAGVDLVPAGLKLSEAWQRFSGSFGKELLQRCLRDTVGPWDWVIIDCPPSLGVLTLTAVHSSDGVLLPVEATTLAVTGLKQMVAAIEQVAGEHHGERPKLTGIVPCRVHLRRRLHWLILDQLEKSYPGKISPSVRENVALAESPLHCKPVITFSPSSHGAQDYQAITDWMVHNIVDH